MDAQKSLSVSYIIKRTKSKNITPTSNAVDGLIKNDTNNKDRKNYVFRSKKEDACNEIESEDEKGNENLPKYMKPVTSTSYHSFIKFQISQMHENLLTYPKHSNELSQICVRSDIGEQSFDEKARVEFIETSDFTKENSILKSEQKIDSTKDLENEINIEISQSVTSLKKSEEDSISGTNKEIIKDAFTDTFKFDGYDDTDSCTGSFASEFNNLQEAKINSENFLLEYNNKLSSICPIELLEVLKKALIEIVLYKPFDPIEFLANYLYKHRSLDLIS